MGKREKTGVSISGNVCGGGIHIPGRSLTTTATINGGSRHFLQDHMHHMPRKESPASCAPIIVSEL